MGRWCPDRTWPWLAVPQPTLGHEDVHGREAHRRQALCRGMRCLHTHPARLILASLFADRCTHFFCPSSYHASRSGLARSEPTTTSRSRSVAGWGGRYACESSASSTSSRSKPCSHPAESNTCSLAFRRWKPVWVSIIRCVAVKATATMNSNELTESSRSKSRYLTRLTMPPALTMLTRRAPRRRAARVWQTRRVIDQHSVERRDWRHRPSSRSFE